MLYHTEIYYTTRDGRTGTLDGTHWANGESDAERQALEHATSFVRDNRTGNIRVLPYHIYMGIEPR